MFHAIFWRMVLVRVCQLEARMYSYFVSFVFHDLKLYPFGKVIKNKTYQVQTNIPCKLCKL